MKNKKSFKEREEEDKIRKENEEIDRIENEKLKKEQDEQEKREFLKAIGVNVENGSKLDTIIDDAVNDLKDKEDKDK